MKLVIQNTSHVWGGNEKWLATLSEGLLRKGHDVIVSCAVGTRDYRTSRATNQDYAVQATRND